MGIQTDAVEILVYIYKKYASSQNFFDPILDSKLVDETGWEMGRIRRAVDYLDEKGLINVERALGGGFFIDKLHPEGIDTIENQDKFKTTFGFELNLGLFKFSWTKEKKP
jgi:hypothetical protein